MEPFIGQIMMFGGNFAPRGWAFCDGQLLAISQNDALFSIIGTIYGGDGRTSFALPDLRGRVAKHPGNGAGLSPKRLGQRGGREDVVLTTLNLPPHGHSAGTLKGTIQTNEEDGISDEPSGKNFGNFSEGTPFNMNANDSSMALDNVKIDSGATGNNGGSQQFDIENPYECVNYIIALYGTYPSRN